MAKIILKHGVLNVEETYDQVREWVPFNDWLELTEYNSDVRHAHKSMNKKGDYRVLIQTDNIQCIKP